MTRWTNYPPPGKALAMTHKPSEWRELFQSYPCAVCGARAGEVCRTSTGKPYKDLHAARARQGNRCPRCGQTTPYPSEPFTLCRKCAFLRELEIERATKHVRENP